MSLQVSIHTCCWSQNSDTLKISKGNWAFFFSIQDFYINNYLSLLQINNQKEQIVSLQAQLDNTNAIVLGMKQRMASLNKEVSPQWKQSVFLLRPISTVRFCRMQPPLRRAYDKKKSRRILKARLHWRFLLRFQVRFQIARVNYWQFKSLRNRQ